jgi:hypothetical protein
MEAGGGWVPGWSRARGHALLLLLSTAKQLSSKQLLLLSTAKQQQNDSTRTGPA